MKDKENENNEQNTTSSSITEAFNNFGILGNFKGIHSFEDSFKGLDLNLCFGSVVERIREQNNKLKEHMENILRPPAIKSYIEQNNKHREHMENILRPSTENCLKTASDIIVNSNYLEGIEFEPKATKEDINEIKVALFYIISLLNKLVDDKDIK